MEPPHHSAVVTSAPGLGESGNVGDTALAGPWSARRC